jgi:hypothetical protein
MLEALQDELPLKYFAFVRDGIDVWNSKRPMPLKEFYTYYLKYIKEIMRFSAPIFRYEDFCADSDRVMQDICNSMGIPFSEEYRNFQQFTSVYGDNTPSKKSRAFSLSEAVVLKRKPAGLWTRWNLNRCKQMIQANSMLGYPVRY